MTATDNTTESPGVSDPRYTVQSVARALGIVDMVAESSSGLTLTEIAKATGVSKSAAHSLIRTLVDWGYLNGLRLLHEGDLPVFIHRRVRGRAVADLLTDPAIQRRRRLSCRPSAIVRQAARLQILFHQ